MNNSFLFCYGLKPFGDMRANKHIDGPSIFKNGNSTFSFPNMKKKQAKSSLLPNF